jgi:sarcosine oxidase subunit beta
VPWLETDGLLCGCWTPEDGHVMPMDGVFAFVKSARALGVRFEEHWRVDRVERGDGCWRVIGPETIEARHVVIAAGVHTRELLRPHGVDIDIRAITYYSVLTESAFVGERVPMIIDVDSGLCVEREGDQLLLAMLSRGRVLRDHDDLVSQFTAAAEHRAPALKDLRIVKPGDGPPDGRRRRHAVRGRGRARPLGHRLRGSRGDARAAARRGHRQQDRRPSR